MGLKKTQLSKDQYVSLVKKLTEDDMNHNIDRIERIRKATRTSKPKELSERNRKNQDGFRYS